MIIGIAVAAVIVIGLIVGYFSWHAPYAKDRDAARTYVVATNVFLRSSQVAGVEYNVVTKLPYGSELITYNIAGDWAEVKANGRTGYVASAYLLSPSDFNLLHGVWGTIDSKDCIISSKCRLAILDYYKSHAMNSGSNGWQIYTKQKDQKPNSVFYPASTTRAANLPTSSSL
ncbi:MAG: SH3 domain-containing protein [Bacteroides sp.]|nr:SH3 domain-containing protein [Bacteroides sp.]